MEEGGEDAVVNGEEDWMKNVAAEVCLRVFWEGASAGVEEEEWVMKDRAAVAAATGHLRVKWLSI